MVNVEAPEPMTMEGLPGVLMEVDVPFIASGLEVIADDHSGEPLCDYDRRILRHAASLLNRLQETQA